jgi:hypothetical protein
MVASTPNWSNHVSVIGRKLATASRPRVATIPISIDASPDQFISIEEVARRLHAEVQWVREKIRRRCPNPMPVFNLGRHLVFDWTQVVEWVRRSPRPVHAAHRRRKKLAKAA